MIEEIVDAALAAMDDYKRTATPETYSIEELLNKMVQAGLPVLGEALLMKLDVHTIDGNCYVRCGDIARLLKNV
jgi:hypothetical protein